MKKGKIFVSIAVAATLSLGALSGCVSNGVGIVSVELTNTSGLVDYYTITYTDGSTSQFTVTNGKDGEDGTYVKEVTLDDVLDTYKSIYGDIGFDEFCEKYLTIDSSSGANTALNSVLRSCFKVYASFTEMKSSGMGPHITTTTTTQWYTGSAVIYKMEEKYTYIVTNYHVVYDYSAASGTPTISENIWAYLYGSESTPVADSTASGGYTYDDYAIPCTYIGGSIDYDVAVIRAETADVLAVNPLAAPVSVTFDYYVGEEVYAVGNPDDGGLSVTKGIVSVDSDYCELAIDGTTTRSYRSIRTDVALTHGNSGGGLFNSSGELIGLNNAGDEDITSMNYAIPASAMTGVADGIIFYTNLDSSFKATKKVYLGITSQSLNSRYVYDSSTGNGYIKEDVTVASVESGGFGAALGLNVGDVIREATVNGTKYAVNRFFVLADLLLTVREGDSLTVTVERDGASVDLTAVVPASALQSVS